jgi:Uma2 family endonuclease
MLFDLTVATGRKRRPDVAFVSFDRWPLTHRIPRTDAWEVVPNLAVEVVSRTDSVDSIVDKIAEYFHAGVNRVWVVFPSQEQVYVYDSPTSVRILTRTDELSGDPILPNFRLPLVELFEETEAVDEPHQARPS